MAPVKAAPKATATAPAPARTMRLRLLLGCSCSPEHDLLLTASQAAAAAARPATSHRGESGEAGFDLFLVVQFMSEGEAAATATPGQRIGMPWPTGLSALAIH